MSLYICSLLLSCQGKEATPDLDARRTELAEGIFATQTAERPAPTVTPTSTFTITPTATPSPTPTVTPIPGYPVIANTSVPQTSEAIGVDTLNKITELATWGKGVAYHVSYSPDGAHLAVASSLGVYIYDGLDLSLEFFLPTRSPVKKTTFSQDSTVVAAGVDDETVLFWKVEDGSLYKSYQLDFEWSNPISSVAFAPDTETFAAGGYGGVALLRWEDGEQLGFLKTMDNDITSLAFSHDGNWMAAGTDSGEISLWNMGDLTQVQSMGHADEITTLAFSPDDELLASCGKDARIWQVESGQLVHIEEHYSCGLNFSPTGNYLAVGGLRTDFPNAGEVVFLQINDWSSFQEWDMSTNAILDVIYSPTDNNLVTLVDHRTVGKNFQVLQLWEDEGLKSWTYLGQAVVSLDFSQDGQNLLAGFKEGGVWLIHTKDGELQGTLDPLFDESENLLQPSHRFGLKKAFFSPDDLTIYTVFQNGSIGSASVDGGFSYMIVNWEEPPDGATLSPNGEIVAAGETSILTGSSGLSLWHSSGGSAYRTLTEENSASLLSFSPDGASLAVNKSGFRSTTSDSDIQVFDVESGSSIYDFEGEGQVSVLQFSPDAALLAVGTTDYQVQIWDMTEGTNIFVLDADKQVTSEPRPLPPRSTGDSGITCLSFSPDGRLLLVGTDYGSVQFWDVKAGILLNEIPYPIQGRSLDPYSEPESISVTSLAFSEDGSLLAVGGEDGTIGVWGIP